MTNTMHLGRKITTKSVKSSVGTKIEARIDGHFVWAYIGKTEAQVITQTCHDVEAGAERPEAYAWSR